MDIDELIKALAAEIISRLNKRVLLFITGGAANIKEVFTVLRENPLASYSIVMSEAAARVIPGEYIESLKGKIIREKAEMTGEINRADLVVIPVMTRNTLSKVSLGIADNLVTLGISEAVMMNKKILVVKDSFDPENPVNISLGYTKNKYYNQMLLNYCERLKNMGIEFTDAGQLSERLRHALGIKFESSKPPKAEKKIISNILTLEDLLGMGKGHVELCLEGGTKISPLARDYIESNGITIKYLREKE